MCSTCTANVIIFYFIALIKTYRVKVSPEQTMKAQRGSTGLAVLIHNLGAR
jgi:hypothetical protein